MNLRTQSSRRDSIAWMVGLGLLVSLLAAPSLATEVVIYQDDNPSPRGWLPPRTTFTSSLSWAGSGHMARHVWEDGRVELGVWALQVEVDREIDWPSAQLEFHVDPGRQVLGNCQVRLRVRGRTGRRSTDTFQTSLEDIGNGKPGYRKVTVPMTAFAPSREELVGEEGHIERWFLDCDAKAGAVFRIDEVRIIDKNYFLPPADEERAPARFVRGPAFEEGTVTFEVNEFCDVAVHVLDEDGKVVRHLAAGVLGENPPEPFLANSKSQAIPFDEKDDDGQLLPPKKYTIRVGLRLKVELDRFLGEDPDSYTFGFPTGIQVDEDGLVYLLHHAGPQRDTNQRIWVYDRDGKYIKEIMPPNPNLHPSFWNARNPYKQADVMSGNNRYDSHALTLMPGGWLFAMAVDHGVSGASPGVRRVYRVNKDGSNYWESKSLAFWMPLHSELMYTCPLDEETFLICDGGVRDEVDARFAYRPRFFAGEPDWRKEAIKHVVFCCRVDAYGIVPNRAFRYAGTDELPEPKAYLGTFGEPGDGPAHFNGPRGVAVNGAGEIFVCDAGNNKIKVYRHDGLFLREHSTYEVAGSDTPLKNPSALTIDRESGALYLTVDGPDPPAKGKRLVKLVEEGGKLRAVWAVDLNELTGYQIALDPSAEPALVWTLFGDGFASFTRIEDLGEKVGRVTHFGGMQRWQGMLQCPNLAVDAEGNCYSGRHLWNDVGLLYRATADGRLHVSRFPPQTRWVSNPAMLAGPDGRLYVLAGEGVLKIAIDDDTVTDEDIEQVEFRSELENVRRRYGLAIDEDGCFYTVAMTKTPDGGRWEGIERHIEKFSSDGTQLAESCVPNLPPMLRSLAVRKGVGYWVFSGQDIHHYSWDGTLQWHVGGFRFRFHEYCGCPRPAFSVDDNLYAWVCDMGRIGVFVLDRKGNQVTRVGGYGNRDCRGEGSLYPLPEIPINNPRMAVANDDYVWVQDYNHQRIVRCTLGFEETGTVTFLRIRAR